MPDAADIVPLEPAFWRERVADRRVSIDHAAEVAARVAVQVIAATVELDGDARHRLFLYICERVRQES